MLKIISSCFPPGSTSVKALCYSIPLYSAHVHLAGKSRGSTSRPTDQSRRPVFVQQRSRVDTKETRLNGGSNLVDPKRQKISNSTDSYKVDKYSRMMVAIRDCSHSITDTIQRYRRRRPPKPTDHRGSECYMQAMSAVLLVPCGHALFCATCDETVTKMANGCPLCRVPTGIQLTTLLFEHVQNPFLLNTSDCVFYRAMLCRARYRLSMSSVRPSVRL